MSKKTLLFCIALLVSEYAIGQPILCPKSITCTSNSSGSNTCTLDPADSTDPTIYWQFSGNLPPGTYKLTEADGMTSSDPGQTARCLYGNTIVNVQNQYISTLYADAPGHSWQAWDWAGQWQCINSDPSQCPYKLNSQ